MPLGASFSEPTEAMFRVVREWLRVIRKINLLSFVSLRRFDNLHWASVDDSLLSAKARVRRSTRSFSRAVATTSEPQSLASFSGRDLQFGAKLPQCDHLDCWFGHRFVGHRCCLPFANDHP